MNIVYVTCCENGFFGLKKLYDSGYEVSRVITISCQDASRYNVSGYADVSQYCKERSIEVVYANDYSVSVSDIGSEPGLLIVNGWNRLISEKVIDRFKFGALGVHAGHPPIGHGRAPIPWNIMLGFSDIEVYVFELTPKADDGDILSLQTVQITQHDNADLLYEKVMLAAANLFIDVLNRLKAGSIVRRRQNMECAEFYDKRSPADSLLDFNAPAIEVFNFVRALANIYPAAFSYLNGLRVEFHTVVPFDCYMYRDVPREPGKIIGALPSGLIVSTKSEPIWILDAVINGERTTEMTLAGLESLVGKVFSCLQSDLST